MNDRQRMIEGRWADLLEHFSVVAVLGARQTGKSALVRQMLGDRSKPVVFDPVQDIELARADPELFPRNNLGPLFLDETQYAPEMLGALKRRTDEVGTPGRYVLSDSQNRAVMKGLADSMAGRIAFVDLYPMTVGEQIGRPKVKHWLLSWLTQVSYFLV